MKNIVGTAAATKYSSVAQLNRLIRGRRMRFQIYILLIHSYRQYRLFLNLCEEGGTGEVPSTLNAFGFSDWPPSAITRAESARYYRLTHVLENFCVFNLLIRLRFGVGRQNIIKPFLLLFR